ncbi:MAG: hypothetical protein KF712_07125 [Akkermansiaceae bacterium]|nr:hypothetical protein [Akkermansiaceae bacterium]
MKTVIEQAGGDVPSRIRFQGYEFRTGCAYRAQLGSIGVVRRAGKNVFELNESKNDKIRDYLKRTKNSRIITSIIQVKGHTLARKSTTIIDLVQSGEDGEAAALAVKESSPSGNASRTPGLNIHDGGIYAYEYSRVIREKDTGKIADILADRPSTFFGWWDSTDHNLLNVTSNPHKTGTTAPWEIHSSAFRRRRK